MYTSRTPLFYRSYLHWSPTPLFTRPKLLKQAPHRKRMRRLLAVMLKKLVLRARRLSLIRFKSDRGEDNDINSDDTLPLILFWLFSFLEIKSSYVLSIIILISFNKHRPGISAASKNQNLISAAALIRVNAVSHQGPKKDDDFRNILDTDKVLLNKT